MAICGVVASESLLTYAPVRSGGIPRSALHLTIPEQAPPSEYPDRLLGQADTDPVLQMHGGVDRRQRLTRHGARALRALAHDTVERGGGGRQRLAPLPHRPA